MFPVSFVVYNNIIKSISTLILFSYKNRSRYNTELRLPLSVLLSFATLPPVSYLSISQQIYRHQKHHDRAYHTCRNKPGRNVIKLIHMLSHRNLRRHKYFPGLLYFSLLPVYPKLPPLVVWDGPKQPLSFIGFKASH